MKRIIWTDKKGFKHASMIRDTDPDSEALFGIPDDPPDMSQTLENFKKILHNEFVERGITRYRDYVNKQNEISAILNMLRRDIISTFRIDEIEHKETVNGTE